VVYLDPDLTRVLAVALLAATTTLGIWRLWPYLGIAAGLGATLVYGLATVLAIRAQGGSITTVLPAVSVYLLAAVGSGALADALAQRTERDDLQHEVDARMIEELTPTVAETAAMKWEHAQRAIREELARARRYGHKVTLVLIGVDDWDDYVEQHGAAVAREAQVRLAAIVQPIVRPTDRVAVRQPGEIVLLLPHTDVRGALRLVERARQEIHGALGLNVRAGVSEFPDDAVDVEGLAGEASFALAFARQSGLTVASRSLLDHA
jgi:diguanylate cyclase (GGDEF)-like protein